MYGCTGNLRAVELLLGHTKIESTFSYRNRLMSEVPGRNGLALPISLGQNRSMCGRLVPDGFLRFSDAVNRLAQGMWGGLPRPVPVQTIKHTSQKASVGFGPWREQAGQNLRAAAVNGELAIYVVAKPKVPSKNRALTRRSPGETEPAVVPLNVLKRLPTSRGGLPDHPIRPSIKTAEGNEMLFALLTVGLLVVRESDFDVWYRSERAKGKWASQRSRSKSRNGRPTKQTEALKNVILARVRAGEWSGKNSITMLHRLLVDSGRSDVPSPDTLARLVDQLFGETGEPELLRIVRVRRK